MQDNFVNLLDGATFMPHDYPSRTGMLLESVWRHRQTSLFAYGIKISKETPELYQQTGFARDLKRFLALPPRLRKEITEDPPFRIWLMQSVELAINPTVQRDELRTKLIEFGQVIDRFDARQKASCRFKIHGTPIQVERYAVDPLIAAVSPPSYCFPNPSQQRELEAETKTSLSVFFDRVVKALERINFSWAAAYHDLCQYVRVIVYAPDASFRSCSAARFAGVIFLTDEDTSLLALEESIVHEYGHQILYNMMELDAVILPETRGRVEFRLPWSGRERDFYGYFHAFYIYILLVHYLGRSVGRSEDEHKYAAHRVAQILKGLLEAAPEIERIDAFTARGRDLFQRLKKEVYRLEEMYESLLK